MRFFSIFTLMTLLHVLITIGVSIRVIKVRLPVATSLAWLLLVFFLPLVGAIAYLVLGEKRLGQKFAARSRAIQGGYDSWLQDLPPEIRSDLQGLSPEARSLSRLAETTVNIPAISGNRLQLLDAAEPILRSIISEIDRAKFDKTLLFMGRSIEKFPLCVKEKGTTTYVVLRWIGVLRFFRNMGWSKLVQCKT